MNCCCGNSLFSLGKEFERLGNILEAKKHYEKGGQLGCHRSQLQLGLLFSMENNFDDAKPHLLSAIKSGNREAAICYAHIMNIEKKYDLADKYYKLSIEQDGLMYSHNLYQYSLFLEEQKRFDESLKYLTASASRNYSVACEKISLILSSKSNLSEINKLITKNKLDEKSDEDNKKKSIKKTSKKRIERKKQMKGAKII
jgi:uncharacterized protein